ncbi:VacJ family lipoprotein [Thalassotalea sp. M1531]|uniref:VacJ family lipoprotein n=1 Tax=Thalassotalea algicola TaxID=2716224 RepID=A0A7Y0Q6S8_9GAMM|nr:VacJ family lipoprotein [Thalassotalea algicola]NMP30290.1 VacJ family lipoprotein [Thalassotalea algicola]
MKIANQPVKIFTSVAMALMLSACSSAPDIEANAEPPTVAMPDVKKEDTLIGRYSDPFEGFNRRMYYFNAKADEYVILPVVSGYKAITPDFVETGVSNFFSNLGEIPTFVNSLLQFKFGVAAETLGRFAVNSTVGVAGLFDIATPIGLDEQDEDFGQTLGYWGVGPGPYLVLPLLGPSSLRDTSGLIIDSAVHQATVNELGLKDEEALLLDTLRAIDTRANVPFRYFESESAFEYEKIKLLYMKFREIQIER